MALVTALAVGLSTMSTATAISTAAAVIGTGVSVKGSIDSAEASQRAENARRRQADLEQTRKSRQIYREAQSARANAIAASTARGSDEGSSLVGALSSITSQAGEQQLALAQNAGIGNEIFNANADMAKAQSMTNLGNSISKFGGTVNNLRPEIDRLSDAPTTQAQKFFNKVG